MKKVLKFVVGGIVVAFLGFWLLLTAGLTVGHINYAFVKHDLHLLSLQARALPIEPGQRVALQVSNGKLIPAAIARTRAWRNADGRLFVTFDRGGGHLGSQGYIYSEDADFTVAGADGFPLAESYEYKRMNGNWWSYDSVED